MNVKALLFDTRSIQRYIYSGNQLKTNIGASYLVDRVFEDMLIRDILKSRDFFENEIDDESWKSETRVDWNTMQKKCTVAYVGGGNALILLSPDTEDGIEQKIVREFSSTLLTRCPGLHIGAAIGPLDLSSSDSFQHGLDALYEKLKENQSTVFPQVNVPYTGLTLSCEVNGETANYCATDKKEGGPRFISQEVAAKEDAEQEASRYLVSRFHGTEAEAVFEDYAFPRALDELGQKRNETRGNYIAVVHIDGNNMGQKFRLLCRDLEDRRILAADIRTKTERSFALLLRWIMEQCQNGAYAKELELQPKSRDSSIPRGKQILPIRPLILGGDDVTFICPAKVSLPFTKHFMEILLSEPPEGFPKLRAAAAQRMDSCAGIAILPTSYPFFRGYVLAEQLCDAAKARMRGTVSLSEEQEKTATADDLRGTSWLDFAILHGEQAPTLEQIREREYSGARGMMHFGPYQVGSTQAEEGTDRSHRIENLIDCVHCFQKGAKEDAKNPTLLPKSKIKEMRNVLQESEDEARRFLVQMNRLEQRLPHIDDWKAYEESLWHKGETPYVDAIEMMDFIPGEV